MNDNIHHQLPPPPHFSFYFFFGVTLLVMYYVLIVYKKDGLKRGITISSVFVYKLMKLMIKRNVLYKKKCMKKVIENGNEICIRKKVWNVFVLFFYAAGAAKPDTQPSGWLLLDQLPVALSTLWMISTAEAFSRQ